MPKKILIAFPPAMLEQLDHVAMLEHRTRSDLLREASRRYLHEFFTRQPVAIPTSLMPFSSPQSHSGKPKEEPVTEEVDAETEDVEDAPRSPNSAHQLNERKKTAVIGLREQADDWFTNPLPR